MKAYLELGLRFLLQPFTVEVLREYEIVFCQLMPYSVGSTIEFLALCDIILIVSSLRLWRTMEKLTIMFPKHNGEG